MPIHVCRNLNAPVPKTARRIPFLKRFFAALLCCLACLNLSGAIIVTNVAPSGQIINSVALNGTFNAGHVIDGNINEPAGGPVSYWLGRTAVPTNFFILDLLGTYTLDSIALLNTHNGQYNDYGTAQFELWAGNAVQKQTNSFPVARYYTFDGNVDDSSTNGVDGVVLDGPGGNTINGTYSNDVPAAVGSGSSIFLDADIGRVEIADPAGAPQPTAFTLSLWVKFLSPPSPLQPCSVIVRTTGSGQEFSAWSHQIRLNSLGQIQCWIYDEAAGTNPNVVSSTVVQSNVWYHVAVTAENGGFMRLYVNGVEEGNAAPVKAIWTGGSEFALGTGSGGGYLPEPILVDELGIWYSVLTPQAIQLLSSGQKPSAFTGTLVTGPFLVSPQLILSGTLSATAGQNVIQPDTFTTNNGLTSVTARYLQFNTLTSINGNDNTGLNEIQVLAQVNDTPPPVGIGTAVRLIWPYSPIQFVLQQSPSLNPPSWSPVQAPVSLLGTNLQVFLPADQSSYFFRLVSP